jgi:hypothetical protein
VKQFFGLVPTAWAVSMGPDSQQLGRSSTRLPNLVAGSCSDCLAAFVRLGLDCPR